MKRETIQYTITGSIFFNVAWSSTTKMLASESFMMYLFISALFVGYRPVLNPPARMAPRALRHHSGELKPEMVTEW